MFWNRKPARPWILALLLFLPLAGQAAERVTLEHDGLTLIGHLQSAADPADGVILMLHGTLAHGRMETMAAVQDLLADHGLNSLSVNLSYGIDAREGMFECDRPITHGVQDHFRELDAWAGWLQSEGFGPLTLLGHSRGGNQMARYVQEWVSDDIRSLVLVAPSTYEPERAAASYDAQSDLPLVVRLDQARELMRMGQQETMLQDVRFLYCESLDVSPRAFLGYYDPAEGHDTPTVLDGIEVPTLVVIGSEDDVVPDLPERMAALEDADAVSTTTIDGAGHFFRDFFADDVADAVAEFVGQR
ncbi:MAG: alpha/beta hydrolase [Thioalkalivibrio sp.]|nr:MAG: alpha/beta hydrolase [Thioalkalivibrio sp.]